MAFHGQEQQGANNIAGEPPALSSTTKAGMKERGQRYRLHHPGRFISRIVFILLLSLGALAFRSVSKPLPEIWVPDPVIQTSLPATPQTTPLPTETPATVADGYIKAPVLVVLDPGHGGRDPGTVALDGSDVYEKDIVLAVALRCKAMLAAEGIAVVLTRETDVALADTVQSDLHARADFANDLDATLFVSIHVNSLELDTFGADKVAGLECYYTEKTAVFSEINDLLLAETLAEKVAEKNGNDSKGVFKRALAVLRYTNMPATLLEIGYLSNKDDFGRLTSHEYLNNTALGIVEAIQSLLLDITTFEDEKGRFVLKKQGVQE